MFRLLPHSARPVVGGLGLAALALASPYALTFGEVQTGHVLATRIGVGVLALAKTHGPAVVDDAAKAALDLGVPTYRFLRRYLERRLPVPLTLRQVDPLIRQLTLYRDLIDRKTGDPL